jgi:hypothetical protein
MLIAHFGYVASEASVTTLQRLLTALNAFPAHWAPKVSVNAVMVGEDASEPQLDPDDASMILWPFDVWHAAENAWRDVSLYADGPDVRPFALEAPSLQDAKTQLVALLEAYQAKTGLPIPPPTVPTPEPVPTIPEPAPVEPAPVEPEPPVKVAATPPITRTKPPWPWVVVGVIGFAGLLTALAVRATGRAIEEREGY